MSVNGRVRRALVPETLSNRISRLPIALSVTHARALQLAASLSYGLNGRVMTKIVTDTYGALLKLSTLSWSASNPLRPLNGSE